MSNFASKLLKGIGALSLVALLLAAGPGLYTGSVSIPSTGTFTTSVPLTSAGGTSLTLNPGSSGSVLFNYNGGGGNGIWIYNGGASVYSNLASNGLSFSGSSTYYNTGGMYVQGSGTFTSNLQINGGVTVNGTISGSGISDHNGITETNGITGNNIAATSANPSFTWPTVAGGGCVNTMGSGTGTVSGVEGSSMFLDSSCGAGLDMTMDGSGNMGIYGGVYAGGQVFSNGVPVAPVYNSSGSVWDGCSTMHEVIGITAQSGTSVTVTLSGAAAFTSASSYVVTDTLDQAGGSNTPASYVTNSSGTQFTLVNAGAFGNVHWHAIGC